MMKCRSEIGGKHSEIEREAYSSHFAEVDELIIQSGRHGLHDS